MVATCIYTALVFAQGIALVWLGYPEIGIGTSSALAFILGYFTNEKVDSQ